jgi:type II secretory ATPase GspE/PulE/Tfp pilus assembly ATPase PilB-like protein
MDSLTKELTAVWRKLGRMLASGVPLLRSLYTIIKETASDQVRNALVDICAHIEKGHTFHEAVRRHPGMFPPSVVTLVQSGEMSGTLERSAMAIADGLADGSLAVGVAPASPVEADAEKGGEPDGTDVVQLATRIIAHAIDSRATDIHISTLSDKPRIRVRVDGVLTDRDVPVVEPGVFQAVVSRIKMMSGMAPSDTQKMQDGRIMLSLKGVQYDLRVNCTPCASGESVVLRILQRNLRVATLDEMQFSEGVLAKLRAWMAKPNGIVVVCGPTGCGKTTTLYSVLQELNVPGVKVMSVEDPVEHRIDGVDQVQVRPSAGITFASALRSILRQDPDIILVGEIRDIETAEVSIQAALTGHLVLTTLHTDDAPSAVCRMVDVGLPPYLVNGTLVGVLAQRLVRKVCQKCKEEYTPDEAILKVMRAQYPHIAKFMRGKGCEACLGNGFRGRTAINEVFELNGELRAVVSRSPTTDELYAHAVRCGMRTLQQDGMDKAAKGVTTVEEVLRVCM